MYCINAIFTHDAVAPFAGAWIEMTLLHPHIRLRQVAPFAGAWIEIAKLCTNNGYPKRSLPSRERGLKCNHLLVFSHFCTSLPSRERGLKLLHIILDLIHCMSLPSRERGLKWNITLSLIITEIVAPFAGAWIEIICC